MGTSPDPPGRAASSDDTKDSSRPSIVTTPDLPLQMMLQFDTSPDLLLVLDSAVVPHGGHFGYFTSIYCFQSVFIFEDPACSHSCQESVGFYLAQFRARFMCLVLT